MTIGAVAACEHVSIMQNTCKVEPRTGLRRPIAAAMGRFQECARSIARSVPREAPPSDMQQRETIADAGKLEHARQGNLEASKGIILAKIMWRRGWHGPRTCIKGPQAT